MSSPSDSSSDSYFSNSSFSSSCDENFSSEGELPYTPGSSASCPDHKNRLKAFQMKFTFQKEPRKRTRTSTDQLEILVAAFDKDPVPSPKVRKALSEKTGMAPRAVQVWFQNRRAKHKIPSTPSACALASPAPVAGASKVLKAKVKARDPSPTIIPAPAAAPAAEYIPFQFLAKCSPAAQEEFDPEELTSIPSSPISTPTEAQPDFLSELSSPSDLSFFPEMDFLSTPPLADSPASDYFDCIKSEPFDVIDLSELDYSCGSFDLQVGF